MARREWHCSCFFVELVEVIDDEVMDGIRHMTACRGGGWTTEVVFSEEDAREVERRCAARGLQCDVSAW